MTSTSCAVCGEQICGNMDLCEKCKTNLRRDDLKREPLTGERTSFEHQSAASSGEGVYRWERFIPNSLHVGLVSILFGITVAGLIFQALGNIEQNTLTSIFAFLIVTIYLFQQSTTTDSLGSGLVILAMTLILAPLMFYGPLLGVRSNPQTAEEFSMMSDWIYDLLIWTMAAAPIAVIIGIGGYLLKVRDN